jgi:hypothetical protein
MRSFTTRRVFSCSKSGWILGIHAGVTHSQRVVIQLNKTRLQQWPDGEAEVQRDIVPDGVTFNPPVIHVVKNVSDLPLRGIVIELEPERR